MQYALRERATALGWHAQDTHVIDADLGLSLIGLEPATHDRVVPAGERNFSDWLLSIIRLISSPVVVASSWPR